MRSVTSTEFAKNFGKYKNLAQRGPMAVTSHENVVGYFLPPVEYEEYRRMMEVIMPKSYAIEEAPEDIINEILSAEMDPSHDL